MEKKVMNGARPKTQTFEMQCPDSGDSGITAISEKGHNIEISVAYHCPQQPGQIKTTREKLSCTIDQYMKWKYVLNSTTVLDHLNAHCDLSPKYTLHADASLKVNGVFKGKTRELASKVLNFAVTSIGKTLTFDSLEDFSVNLNEEFVKEINESELGKQKFVYAETIKQKPVVVYLKREHANLIKTIDTMQNSVVTRRQNITKTITVDLIWMKKAKLRNIQSAHQAVHVQFDCNSGSFQCTITGPRTEAQKCLDDLRKISREQLVSKKCQFAICYQHDQEVLAELDLTATLDQSLAEENIKSFTIQRKGNVVVYAFDNGHAEKARQKIIECVIEKPYMFDNKFKIQQIECLQSMQKLYKNLLAIRKTESEKKIFVIGLKEAVVSVTKELDLIRTNRNSAEENRSPDSSETLVFYHDVPNEKICEFLGNSTQLSQCLSKMDCKVNVAFKNNTKQIRVTCAKKNRTDVLKHIKNAESKAVCKPLKFENTAEKDFAISNGKQYMAEIVVADDVLLIERIETRLLDKELCVLEENTLKPNSSTEQRFCWVGKYEKRLHLQRIGAEDVQCSHRILFYPYSKRERSISAPAMTDGGLCTNVHLPEWIDGNSNENQQIRSLIATILNRAEKDKEDCLAMCLDPIEPWTPIAFTSEITLEATNWMTKESKWPKTVILFSLNGKNYENAIDGAQQLFKNYAEDERRSRKRTIIQVYEGELNTVKADVLVNTAAANLELKHGKVSAALLATAGDELQKECAKNYPKGISKRQVAETTGHSLQCKKVYHITLEKYAGEEKKSIELIEDIRESMRLCMERASNACFKTIAFPAFGTGTLKYPVDFVAPVMFKSVEDFKRSCPNSTLECVMFVIYPKDTGVLEYFKSLASDLDKADGSDSVSIESEIIGLKTNVDNAESKILHVIETAKKGNIVRHIKNVTDAQYCILLDFPDAQKSIKSFESIQYDTERQIIILTGKPLEMEKVIPMLEKHLQNIQPLNHIELNMQEYSKSKINEHVMFLNEKYKDVKCVLHPNGNCLYIYGKKERLEETKDELLRRLTAEVYKPNRGLASTSHHIYTSEETVQATKTNEVESNILKPIETTTKVLTQSKVQTGKSDIPTDSNKGDSTFRGEIHDKNCVERQADEKLSKNEKLPTVAGYLYENDNEETLSRAGQKSSRNFQEVDAKFYNVGGIRLYAIASNILDIPADCIVNAANADLSHSIGVALEISKAAGEDVQRECDVIKSSSGPLIVGSVVKTTQGRLKCKLLLHAVGPRWDDYQPISKERLKNCMYDLKSTVVNCLVEANKHNMKSIALPTISSGLFRVPKELCAMQYAEAVIDFTRTPKVLESIYFIDINTEMIDNLRKCFAEMIEKNQKPKLDITKYIEQNPSTETVPTKTVMTSIRILKIGNSKTSEQNNKTQTTRTETNNNAASAPTQLTTETSKNKVADKESAVCVICMDHIVDETKLKCGHVFCKECIEGYFRVKKVCPTCGKVCGVIYGDQPDGTMEVFKTGKTLAGYEGCQSIGITYQFKSGQQGPEHPHPGTPYTGIQRTAYLPDNKEGREICIMLGVAFERRLVFTIGTSRTTGKEGVITWNDIHHKTDPRPNTQFGYPDSTYLQRVREELEVKGVTKEDISDSFLKELQKESYRKTFVSKSK